MTDVARSVQAPTVTADASDPPFSVAERRTLNVFTVLLVLLVLFQMVGVPTPAGPVEVILPATYIAIAYLAMYGQVRVDGVSTVFYGLFLLTVTVGDILLMSDVSGNFKITSMGVVLVIYALYIFRVPVTERVQAIMADRFVKLMLCMLPIIAFQWLAQIAIHPGLWGSLQNVIPQNMLIIFNYVHPIRWDSPWIQPNGIVFLEVSILTQFLVVAFLVEFSFFQRLPIMIALGVGVLSTLAASGPFMLGACAPLLLMKLPRRLIPVAVGGVVVVAVLALFTDVFSVLIGRLGEAGSANTSGYLRLVGPFVAISNYLATSPNVFQGLGAGAGDRLGTSLPIAKLIVEYGMFSVFPFAALFIHTIATARRPALLVWGIFVFFNVMGAYLAAPIGGIMPILLCGLFVVPRAPAAVPVRQWDRRRLPLSRPAA